MSHTKAGDHLLRLLGGDWDSPTGNAISAIEAEAQRELRAALVEYIDHDLGGVHLGKGQGLSDYEPCEELHLRLGALAYPDKAMEYALLRDGKYEGPI